MLNQRENEQYLDRIVGNLDDGSLATSAVQVRDPIRPFDPTRPNDLKRRDFTGQDNSFLRGLHMSAAPPDLPHDDRIDRLMQVAYAYTTAGTALDADVGGPGQPIPQMKFGLLMTSVVVNYAEAIVGDYGQNLRKTQSIGVPGLNQPPSGIWKSNMLFSAMLAVMQACTKQERTDKQAQQRMVAPIKMAETGNQTLTMPTAEACGLIKNLSQIAAKYLDPKRLGYALAFSKPSKGFEAVFSQCKLVVRGSKLTSIETMNSFANNPTSMAITVPGVLAECLGFVQVYNAVKDLFQDDDAFRFGRVIHPEVFEPLELKNSPLLKCAAIETRRVLESEEFKANFVSSYDDLDPATVAMIKRNDRLAFGKMGWELNHSVQDKKGFITNKKCNV